MYVKFVSSLIIKGKSKLFNIYQLFNDYRFKAKIFLTLFVLSVSCLVEWCYMLTGNVWSYSMVAISKHFTVNQAETFIEAQSLI